MNEMAPRNRSEAESAGFVVDKTCYPWVAYKGPRFQPTEFHYIDTDRSRASGVSFVCRPCKNAAARAAYTPRPQQRRGWIEPTRDGDKKQARRRINYLVDQGRIPHPNDLPCMDCADEVFIGNYRHEYDHALGYDGENQLYVEAVCSKCHHNREGARRGR